MGPLFDYLPGLATATACIVGLIVLNRLLSKWQAMVSSHHLRRQVIMITLTGASALLILMVLPIGDSKRGQILSFFAILLSAAIALSSTTFLGNALAGVMLRAVRSFRMGDFVRTGEHFGRVSERGLFHTEIQTEDRDLTTIPNLYLVTHPVTTVRSSGTIVSATVSLGYDVARTQVEELLLEAAQRAALTDPFVQILELGDYSVSYRVAGLLSEVKQLVSVRSHLRGQLLDTLHGAGIEIVSPAFMNTRAADKDTLFIPRASRRAAPLEATVLPETILFDKAEEAETLEALQATHAQVLASIQELQAKPEDGPSDETVARIAALDLRKTRLETLIAKSADRASDE